MVALSWLKYKNIFQKHSSNTNNGYETFFLHSVYTKLIKFCKTFTVESSMVQIDNQYSVLCVRKWNQIKAVIIYRVKLIDFIYHLPIHTIE